METTIPPLYGRPISFGSTMRPKLVFLLITLLFVLYVLSLSFQIGKPTVIAVLYPDFRKFDSLKGLARNELPI
jgi:hypothetical protein